MSHITKIGVQHVRNHTKKVIELSPVTTIITGKNGTGKTSLLEALYIALQGTSFRGSDADVLQKDSPWYRIDIEMDDGTVRTVKFDSMKQTGRKQFVVDEKISYRLTNTNKYPVVLFEPEDLRLINGSPVRRRFFIDHFISQINPLYSQSLRKYDRALKQRNNLLKQPHITPDELFVWNVAMSEYGAYIVTERTLFAEKINQLLTNTYQSISRTDDVVAIHYSHTLVDNIQQKLMSDLSKNTDKDKLLGYTSVGPHRDDIIFSYNQSLAASGASRGENRSIILALKQIEADIIYQITDLTPVILLDDVFSELDEARQENITTNNYQTLITSTSTTKTIFPSNYINL
ncbi:MAG: recF [Candidatus Saccharibacteria bacterium]|nr:recF [Candidatus Saccharibacteria bacterium]